MNELAADRTELRAPAHRREQMIRLALKCSLADLVADARGRNCTQRLDA
jgi:hypothetical protein